MTVLDEIAAERRRQIVQVSKEVFFRLLFERNLDVHPVITNDKYPYTTVWQFHRQVGRPPFGKSVNRLVNGKIVTDFYVIDGAAISKINEGQ